jgi:5'-AMP-activated protein kinase regulatory gamma subunit
LKIWILCFVQNLAAAKTYDNLDMTLKEANAHRRDWFEGVQTCCRTDTLGNVMEKIAKAEVISLTSRKQKSNSVYLYVFLFYFMFFFLNLQKACVCPFQVHRLVVVDKDDSVVGVVSLSDILKYLVLDPAGKDH